MKLTLLRHGRSKADDEKVCEGRYDSPLTSIGIEQAETLAGYWKKHPPGFEYAVCSTLKRACETASIITDSLGIPLEAKDCWMEHDNGPLAGLPYEKAQKRFPLPAFRGRYEAYTSEGGESQMSILRRAQSGIEDLMQSQYTHVLVVAHGGILNAALRDILGTTRASFAFGDTGFGQVIMYRDKDEARLLAVNLQPHLSDA